jgi:hypothetical protein
MVIATLVTAPKRQTARFVFTTFVDATGLDGAEGWGDRASHAYIVVIGILVAQYTLIGQLLLDTTSASAQTFL